MRSLAVGLVGVAVVALAVLAWWSRPDATTFPESEPPRELARQSVWFGEQISVDLHTERRDLVGWDSLERGFKVSWLGAGRDGMRRAQVEQHVDTPYAVIDIGVVGTDGALETAFVLGGYSNGDECVERFRFAPVDPDGLGALGAADAVNLDAVRERRELLRTSRFGHVRALVVDREGSSVYLLTLESAELLRLAPETGAVTVELTAEHEPLLAESTFMQFKDDMRLGRSLLLYTGETGGCIVGPFARTLELVDADCDGRFERSLVWRDRDWEPEHGYTGWVRP